MNLTKTLWWLKPRLIRLNETSLVVRESKLIMEPAVKRMELSLVPTVDRLAPLNIADWRMPSPRVESEPMTVNK